MSDIDARPVAFVTGSRRGLGAAIAKDSPLPDSISC